MVVACIGLAVALSGTGYAVTALPRNSVGTAQLKANAVNSAKVKNRSLKAADFAAGQIPPGPQGPPGATGATGATGAAGPEGPPNPNAVSAQNADRLDNLDSTAFLQNGTAAAGDLTGTYPGPTVAPNAVSGGEIQDLSLTSRDVGIASGTWTTDPPAVAAHSCSGIGLILAGGDTNDIITATPNGPTRPLMLMIDRDAGSSGIAHWLCNPTATAHNLGAMTFSYMIVRIP